MSKLTQMVTAITNILLGRGPMYRQNIWEQLGTNVPGASESHRERAKAALRLLVNQGTVAKHPDGTYELR